LDLLGISDLKSVDPNTAPAPKSRSRRKSPPQAAPAAVPATGQAIVLPASLDLTQATELAKMLSAARGSDIVVDASGVERAGTQCLQVLLSAAASWQADHAGFSLVKPSDAFKDAVRLLGLEAAFPCEEPRA
jgi:chemotaxis protein CheX